MIDLALRRQFFAEELEAVCRLRSPGLVDAFATVARERFLPPGPWTVLADTEGAAPAGTFAGGMRLRTTPDADPRHVYHNIAIAIDPARQLFNGQPATLGVWLDALGLAPGARVLHVGCGLGYYTAVVAEWVGPAGRVVAFEVDPALAAGARQNLASRQWVDVRCGDASQPLDETFDAILVNAGVTHPLNGWLDALGSSGRIIVPLTATMAATGGGSIGKGLAWLFTGDGSSDLAARVLSVVAIYSAVAVRDQALDEPLGNALRAGPAQWLAVRRLRRDAHDQTSTCWLHTATCCLSRS